MSNKNKNFPEYRIYKPRSSKDGAASRLQIRQKEGQYGPITYVFWESTKQTGVDDKGNSSFGWKDKALCVTMKLEENDIGELLACLNGVKDYAGSKDAKGNYKGIYHQNTTGNTILQLQKVVGKDGMPPSYGFRISSQKKESKSTVAIQHFISLAEAEILKILLQNALCRMYGWVEQ